MTKAVITGGAGFIGSHLADELVARGYDVTIIDDLSTGKEANIAHLLKKRAVEFVEGSINTPGRLEKALRGAGPVFHLAAVSGVPQSIADPLATHEINVTGTLNVLLAARQNRVAKVIFASSAAVYGDTLTQPQGEDLLPNPQSPYAASKLAGEHYCAVFHRIYALPTTVLRFYNVYGPRQDPDAAYAGVIPKFIDAIARGDPPVVFGDGERTRDFTFVKDVVAALVLAAESGAAGVYNIGSGRKISIIELARTIVRAMGQKLQPQHQAARPGEVGHSWADISRAGSFGYRPSVNLEEGLKLTIEAWRKPR